MGTHKLKGTFNSTYGDAGRIPLLILILLLTPVIFLNNGDYHDWGDDFAQYMLQGYHLLGLKTGVNVHCLDGYGPAVKGPLFSLILSPVLLAGGKIFLHSKIIVATALIFCGLLTYSIVARELNSPLTGILAALFLVYNSVILVHKDQVLPDTIFMALLLTGISCFTRSKVIGVVICSAGLVLLKPVGSIFPALILMLYLTDSQLSLRKRVLFVSILSAVVFTALIIPGLWPFRPAGDNSVSWYLGIIRDSGVFEGSIKRAVRYFTAAELFIDNDVPWILNLAGKVVFLLFFILGTVSSFLSLNRIAVLFMTVYIFVILIYPYDHDPLRLLVLIFPLMVITVLNGIRSVCRFTAVRPAIISIPFLIIMILMNIPNAMVSISGKRNAAGPFTDSFTELKQFIESHVPEEDMILTQKPWAVALMTNRSTTPYYDLHTDKFHPCTPAWKLESRKSVLDRVESSGSREPEFSKHEYSLYRIAGY